jgi:DNA-binding CsgD family transcriptional regulator
LSKRDANHVRRLRDLLERYRPSARPIVDELIHELRPIVDSEAAIAMRPVRGELGWTLDFLYGTMDTRPVRDFIATAMDGWTPFFPVTPEPLRNRALRPRPLSRHRRKNPSPAYKELLVLNEKLASEDDLGVSVCDGDVVLAWVACTRTAPFGPREIAIVDAIIPALHARLLLEHQLGHAQATRALLEAALEAIPTAAFVVAGSAIEHANATGRTLLDRDRAGVVEKLRESVRAGSRGGPFAITPVEAPGMRVVALAVLRGHGAVDVEERIIAFATRHGLTARQSDVLQLLARGYGNKTIAERMSVAEATVEEHVTNLFRKVGVDSRAELVAKFWTA